MALLSHALCTVAEATRWIRPLVNPIVNDDEEAVIEQLINAVTERFEGECGRIILARDQTFYLDGTGKDSILLPAVPFRSLDELYSLDYNRDVDYTYNVLDSYHHVTPAGRLYLVNQPFFPKGRANIKIIYSAGWLATPSDVNVAACQWVADWFKAWTSKRDGIESISFAGVNAFIKTVPVPIKVQPVIDLYRNVAGAAV